MKVADLERSKRLKRAGWKPDGEYSWWERLIGGKSRLIQKGYINGATVYSAPTAGEMIEWLLVGNICVFISPMYVEVSTATEIKIIKIETNLCNALADAVIWVLENKK